MDSSESLRKGQIHRCISDMISENIVHIHSTKDLLRTKRQIDMLLMIRHVLFTMTQQCPCSISHYDNLKINTLSGNTAVMLISLGFRPSVTEARKTHSPLPGHQKVDIVQLISNLRATVVLLNRRVNISSDRSCWCCWCHL